MAISEVTICNRALAKVGAERIISLADSNERAALCAEVYPTVRDDLLRGHPWNFAISRVALAPIMGEPLFDWGFQFQLPSDCLRVLETDLAKEAKWKVEGRRLMCDFEAVSIKFIKNVNDPSQFDANFVELLACKMAADISYSLVQSVTLRDQLIQEYERKLRLARSFDAQEGQGDRVYADTWLNSRY